MTCRASVGGQPHPADTKIGCERHNIQNFEKNGTYVKYNGLLRMPTNFFDDPTIFGDRSPKKQKKPLSTMNRPAINMLGTSIMYVSYLS